MYLPFAASPSLSLSLATWQRPISHLAHQAPFLFLPLHFSQYDTKILKTEYNEYFLTGYNNKNIIDISNINIKFGWHNMWPALNYLCYNVRYLITRTHCLQATINSNYTLSGVQMLLLLWIFGSATLFADFFMWIERYIPSFSTPSPKLSI